MRKKRKPRTPARRLELQSAVMAITLSIYPKWCTIHELAREIGPSGALTRATLELIQIGCLESHGSSVRPSKPVAYVEGLDLP
jgi:hypothetical protein